MFNRFCRRLRRRRAGYTLIELLIIITLLGIAASMVVPRLTGRERLTVQAAVREIVADLSFAQSDALAHQQFRRVVFFDDGTGYAILRVTEANFNDAFDPDTADYINDPVAADAEDGRYIVNFNEDSRFAGVTVTDASIDGTNRFVTYDALGGTVMSGLVPGIGGRIEVSFNGMVYEITIEPFTGKLTVAKLA
jgi:type II secretory pathway pseudopilin PulG